MHKIKIGLRYCLGIAISEGLTEPLLHLMCSALIARMTHVMLLNANEPYNEYYHLSSCPVIYPLGIFRK